MYTVINVVEKLDRYSINSKIYTNTFQHNLFQKFLMYLKCYRNLIIKDNKIIITSIQS